MRDALLTLVNTIIRWGLILVAFATPLLFTPITTDPFEFPKQVFLYSLVLLLTLAWMARFVLENQVKITKTPLDLPIFLFLVIYILSAIFAPIKYTALVGAFGRFHGGLTSIIAYILLYYLAVSNLKSVRDVVQIIVAFISSSLIVVMLFLSQYFGFFFLPFDFAKIRNFTPLSSPNQLGIFLALAFTLRPT